MKPLKSKTSFFNVFTHKSIQEYLRDEVNRKKTLKKSGIKKRTKKLSVEDLRAMFLKGAKLNA